jgi:hypothetical protein
LYQRCGKPALAPSKNTIWQVLTRLDAAAVDVAVGAWLAAQAGIDITVNTDAAPDPPQTGQRNGAITQHQQEPVRVLLAVDGKRVRGALDADGNAPHLLAAATHQQGLVLAQIDVHHKTNEIPMFAPLLDRLSIAGMLITADCLHTQTQARRLPAPT